MKKRSFFLVILLLLLGLFAEKLAAQAAGIKPELIMYRHNGSSGNTPASVVMGDILGTLKWNGLTAIGSVVTGASVRSTTRFVAPGVLNADMVFSTSGADRVIITPDGLVGIGTMTPTFNLDVVGNTHTSGRFHGRIHFDFGEPTDLPNSYSDEAYFERKTRAQLGLGANTYPDGGILSMAPGGNSLRRQLFTGGSDGLYTRSQDAGGGNTWAAWEKILTSADINGRPNIVPRFLPPDNPSHKLGEAQIFDNTANVVVGGIPAAPSLVPPTFDASDKFTVNGNSRTNGNLRATGNAVVDGSTTTNSLAVTTNATVGGNATVAGTTTTTTLAVTTHATVGDNLTANSLNVSTNAAVVGNTTTGTLTVLNDGTVGGNLGIGKAATGFDLDVAGESNFDRRVKIGAPAFPTTPFLLAVGGGVIAEEVLVQLQASWPDYVFEPNHALPSLPEVEKFVSENKHLPGVADAKTVAAEGLNLGKMQATQMEKIEELYLHVIALSKQVEAQAATIAELQSQLSNLKK